MSRIGKKPVPVPDKVKVSIDGPVILVDGPLGQLSLEMRPEVVAKYDESTRLITVEVADPSRLGRALYGTYRALIANNIVGVTTGYERKLELQGVGYIAAIAGQVLQLRVGLANELQVPIPAGLTVTCPDQQHVSIKGCDKQIVTHFAAAVRALRKPEPYKGKGIRFEGEVVRRKEGKAAAK
jgi:large subunit ribosomal protein L6